MSCEFRQYDVIKKKKNFFFFSSPQVPQGRFVFSNQNQEVVTSSTAGVTVSLATQGGNLVFNFI